jgi:glutamate dehydrogenase (NAD(P)+)
MVVAIHEPRAGLRAVVVVDNVACGRAIGGVRLAPDADAEECFRLARAMTLKNAAAGLPHGGGKSVIIGDPHAPAAERERLVRAFAQAIRDLRDYIPGPDMGTNESAMAWVLDEIGRAVGLPRALGGIPLDDIGATGWGVAIATEVACEHAGLSLEGARVAVQGFGAVGRHAAGYLVERGAVLVAAADSGGGIHDPGGIDVDALAAHKARGGTVPTFRPGTPLAEGDIVAVDCDVWVPAARPDALTERSAPRLRARIVVEGANIPTTADADRLLANRGVLVVPDIIANAGGVITAAVEFRGGTDAQARAVVEERIRANTARVLEAGDSSPRAAAHRLARERVLEAMSYRRFA